MKKILLFTITAILTTSCAKEEKKVEQKPKIATHEGVSIIVEGVFKENDNVAVFYKKEDRYSGENISQLVLGSCEVQKLKFEIPEDVAPEQIKILLSRNPAQKEISLKNITVKFQNDSIDGSNGKFVNLFALKEQVRYDKTTFKYLIDAENKPYYPWIAGSDNFKSKLSSIMNSEVK